MSLKATILGCGNSTGVPAIGNYWGKCDPNEPKNRRFRCSLAVESEETTIIVDTGADLRHQTTLFDIIKIDGVFYTHHHSDHTHGIDDLRSLFFRNDRTSIPCYGGAKTMHDIMQRFDFMFKGGNNAHFYPIILTAHPFDNNQYGNLQCFKDISYIPFEMDHGTCTTVGYRFKDLSYCVDMKSMDDKVIECVKGSRIWIVDGAGYHDSDHTVHADLETLYRYNDIIGAQEVYVMSLSPFRDYQTLKKELPEGFYPAYDGLTFTL
ncbi:MAG: MBL fold metallo-hydrolase [Alphaproteobacteria bacterium]|nr:MBL fold metallo-hydrolase [Alphaproteobacteria bacterium]